ncbi:MAG: hypothetical protein M1617_03505 [Actinobacteria bacterium]|nr:hypothetical protein [Actinomycetota bacterium]MCL5887355.1 hypothetical protein [Actinomycetota bacterium]
MAPKKTRGRHCIQRIGILVLLVAALLGAQFGADAQAVQASRDASALGRAGFAYLTGVRTFIAAVLWNRIEPIYHGFYEHLPLHEQLQTLPTLRMVIALDPQFVDSYYIAAWMLAQRGDVETGLDIARQGVENNPDSGLLRFNYAQVLYLFADDLEGAVQQADVALERAQWRDYIEQHDAYAGFGAIYRSAGMTDRNAYIQQELVRLDALIDDSLAPVPHDHDGDGVPDH